MTEFDSPADFYAEIEIYPLGPDTRSRPAFNYIRWQFAYAADIDRLGPARAIHNDVWPIFRNAKGNSIPVGVPLEGTLPASMHIIFEGMVPFHLARLRIGTEFYCLEGHRKVAKGKVTSIVREW